jgi:peptidoglycan/xylan/chitin deacetylase (PgdA/CDA1 family)
MLKKFKQTTLKSLKFLGVSRLIHNSGWRRQRLLILAYHGIALSDEDQFNGSQFISVELFRQRLEILRTSRAVVLPLDEGIARLYAKDLPDRAVVITFDDGLSDFYRMAFPIIKEFKVPVTLYLTTFYCHYQRPVFDLMSAYVLWKGRRNILNLRPFTGTDLVVDLNEQTGRDAALAEICAFATAKSLSADDKDLLAAALATHLGVDYEDLAKRRVMHNLMPEEVRALANYGIDIQLHTHRHRTPLDRKLFGREIEDNRTAIEKMTGKLTNHFCYPSGRYHMEFLPWLRELGVLSGVTCDSGLAGIHSNQLLLPRFLDNASLSPIEFESWLFGVSAVLPQRRRSRITTIS